MYRLFQDAVDGKYLPYRAFNFAGTQILNAEYDQNSEVHLLQRKLQKRFGGHIDNHSGWKVTLKSGAVVVYHFSDWHLYIHIL